MRLRILKVCGFVLWNLLLFFPLLAQAGEGFDVYLPIDTITVQKKVKKEPEPYNGPLYYDGVAQSEDGDQWALKFNAGKDTVLTNDLPKNVLHDRLQLDDGERESYRFSIGVNYRF